MESWHFRRNSNILGEQLDWVTKYATVSACRGFADKKASRKSLMGCHHTALTCDVNAYRCNLCKG